MRKEDRANRWRRVTLAATKQCLRAYSIEIQNPIHLSDYLKADLSHSLSLLAMNGGQRLDTLLNKETTQT